MPTPAVSDTDIHGMQNGNTTSMNPLRASHLAPETLAASVGVRMPKPDVWRRISESVARVTSVGVMMSLLLHVTFTTVAVIIGLGGGIGSGHGGSGDNLAAVDYALTSPAELTDLPAGMVDADQPPVATDAVPEVGTPGMLSGAGGFDEPGKGEGLGQIAEGLGGAGGGGVGDGEGLGGGGMGGGASFFGVEARGSRFVYICDVSGSMNERDSSEGASRLACLKLELTRSLNQLLEHMSFGVIVFSSDARPLGGTLRWINATESGKRFANERVSEITAFGGTEPWPAFEQAFVMRPAPDAIYFMTDGVFDPSVALKIAQRNTGSKKIPIHCITLVEKSGEEVMRKIAAESGGTYQHVSGSGAGSTGGGKP